MADCKNTDSLRLDKSSESDFLNDWAVFSNGDIKECEFDKCKEKEEAFQRSESSSSSDVDVIDEDNVERLEEAQLSSETSTALPAPYITFSSKDILPEEMQSPSDSVEDITPDHIQYDDELEMYGVDINCLVSIGKGVLAICVVILLYNVGCGCFDIFCKDNQGMIKEMEQIIEDLNLENSNLRNQLISENHKKAALEIQIKDLENENREINQKVDDALSEVKMQSVRLYSESKILQNKINELREQVNIMRFDNEELQKQLVRLRYRSSQLDTHLNPKVDSEDDDSASNEGNNSSEALAEDLKKLHQELISEIAKIKNWNEVVEAVAKKLHNSNSEDKQWTLLDMKQNFHDIVLEAQKNIADTVISFQNLNISDMFTKYMKYNEETVENVFGFIGQYFQVAQEKTRKMFKRNVPNVEKEATINNMWSTAEKLKEKWSFMKNKFFKMTEILIEGERKKTVKNPTSPENKENSQEDSHTQKTQTSHKKQSVFSDKKVEDYNRDSYFGDYKPHYDKDDSITWLFRRAADRAKLRKKDN